MWGDITVAWPLGLCPHCSLEAELHPLPWPLPADASSPLPDAAYKLVCYFTNWAHHRPGLASIWPQDLDPFLCTHLVFAFASVNNNQLVAKDLQDEQILYPEFNKLKKRCVRVEGGGSRFQASQVEENQGSSPVPRRCSCDSSGPSLPSGRTRERP